MVDNFHRLHCTGSNRMQSHVFTILMVISSTRLCIRL